MKKPLIVLTSALVLGLAACGTPPEESGLSSSSSQTSVSSSTLPSSSMTTSVVEKCTVTFVSDGQVFNTAEVIKGDKIGDWEKPTKEGKRFAGWIDDSGRVWDLINDAVTRDIRLVASWNDVTVIHLDSNGGSTTNDMEAVYGEQINSLPTPTKENREFVGWYYENVAYSAPFGFYFQEKEVTFVARWKWVVGDFEFVEIAAGKAAVSKYTGTETEVVIPAMADGIAVVSVGEQAFSENATITKVTIPSGVKSIEREAFNACSALQTVIMPNTVTSIGTKAFMDCMKLEEARIPEGVEYIGLDAFAFCFKLADITIPSSIKFVEPYAFYMCKTVAGLAIPRGIAEIPNCFVGSCENLQVVSIPATVTKIEDDAFLDCRKLSKVYFAGTKAQWEAISIGNRNDSLINADIEYESEVNSFSFIETEKYSYLETNDGKIFDFNVIDKAVPSLDFATEFPGKEIVSINREAFRECTELTSIVIPDGITKIQDEAFASSWKLKTVVLPESVTEIEGNAFTGCQALQSVNIPSSVTKLNNCLFYSCTSLKSFVVPDTVTEIGTSVFAECYALESVTIPAGLTVLGGWAFNNCNALVTVNFKGTMSQWNDLIRGPSLFDGTKVNTIVCSDGSISRG